MSTPRLLAVVIPGILVMGLMIWQFVAMEVRDRRGRTLFMRETGKSKFEWENLAPIKQKKWTDADREDRELGKFVEDYNKKRVTK